MTKTVSCEPISMKFEVRPSGRTIRRGTSFQSDSEKKKLDQNLVTSQETISSLGGFPLEGVPIISFWGTPGVP